MFHQEINADDKIIFIIFRHFDGVCPGKAECYRILFMETIRNVNWHVYAC